MEDVSFHFANLCQFALSEEDVWTLPNVLKESWPTTFYAKFSYKKLIESTIVRVTTKWWRLQIIIIKLPPILWEKTIHYQKAKKEIKEGGFILSHITLTNLNQSTQ